MYTYIFFPLSFQDTLQLIERIAFIDIIFINVALKIEESLLLCHIKKYIESKGFVENELSFFVEFIFKCFSRILSTKTNDIFQQQMFLKFVKSVSCLKKHEMIKERFIKDFNLGIYICSNLDILKAILELLIEFNYDSLKVMSHLRTYSGNSLFDNHLKVEILQKIIKVFLQKCFLFANRKSLI